MNKKEQAILDDAIYQAKLANAFRRTELILKDLPAPNQYAPNEIFGFDFNAYSFLVTEHYSTAHSHGRAENGVKSTGTASQNSRDLFSTKALAFKAMRHEVENECAKKLLKIDEMIKENL